VFLCSLSRVPQLEHGTRSPGQSSPSAQSPIMHRQGPAACNRLLLIAMSSAARTRQTRIRIAVATTRGKGVRKSTKTFLVDWRP
jgi:hypothetical protein